MQHTSGGIRFGPYRLDIAAGRLAKRDQPVPLQPRPLAVLCYLAARPGAVVPRDELIAKLWQGTHVTKAVLKVAVRGIREALDDDADAPRYIETVGRDGYRFIGTGAAAVAPIPVTMPIGAAPFGSTMVGREQELGLLHASLARAAAGTRTIVFVNGEAGIGKTTLLDRFVAEIDPTAGVSVARGQCLEQYGEGEAYLPVLEALGRLARDDATGELAETLGRHAPTWVSQMAALDPARHAPWRRDAAVATMPARMLREMADALELFTRRRTLLLVLEDLQWSDPSSVDLLACIARRRDPARLLVVGSVRPLDLSLDLAAGAQSLHHVRHDLQAKGLCEDLTLGLLTRDDVATYVAARFAGAAPDALRRLATRVHERTEGNALFMVNVLHDLVGVGLLAWRDGHWSVEGSIDAATERVPSGLQELIGSGLRGLAAPARQVLEAASVVGDEFTVAAVAGALDGDPEEVEDACEQLAAQGALIIDRGVAEWPDGSVTGRYRFRHALYRRVLYEGVAAARRVRLHAAVGRRVEAGFGPRAGEHAAELAMHFSRAHGHERALHYHELAAGAALDRHAAHEAVVHLSAALGALAHVPETSERARRELALVVARATLLMAIRGYAAAETEQAFAHARSLCAALPAEPALHPVLRGMVSYHQVRAEFDQALAVGEQLLRHAEDRPDDRVLRVQAHYGQGTTYFHLGALAATREHLEVALREYDPAAHQWHALFYGGYDPAVACSMWLAWTLAMQGELDAAADRAREGAAFAERHDDAFSLAWAHYGDGVARQFRNEWVAAEAAATEGARLADEHGFPYVLGLATVNRGWAMLNQRNPEGIAIVRHGVAIVDRTGAALGRANYLGLLGATYVFEGDRKTAIAKLDEAVAEVERSGERIYEAGLLIGRSGLLADDGRKSSRGASAAEHDLRRALDVAHMQGARLLELRAAVALARHCRERSRAAEGRAVLAEAYAWFEGRPAATPEIASAGKLLAALSS